MTESFYQAVIRKDHRFTSTDVCKDVALLEPGTRAAVAAILAEAKKTGVDLRILETFRSQARQHMLYEKRLTELSRVGCHNFGIAVDFALYDHGKYVEDGSKYGSLWTLLKKHHMVSGQDWNEPNVPHSFRDSDHAQRIQVWRQNAMFAETFYPSPTYDPFNDPKPTAAMEPVA